jgi:peptide/nickel transport system substrate-binding protein
MPEPPMTDAPGLERRTLIKAAGLGAAMAGGAGWLRRALAETPGGTLTVAIPNSPTTLDPINAIIHDPMVITYLIFENLIDMDVDGNLVPQLAKAMPEISADKLTYTFDLRDDVAFQNGQPLTADDVKYSFESMLDPKRNAARRGIFTKIQKVVVDGPHRVQVVLSEPYSPWLSFLYKYMGIWPKDSREKLGDEHFRLHPTGVGTGPGMFAEWRPNESVTLVRNPHYWQKDIPHWDKMVTRLIPDDSSRVAYLMTRQVDIIGAPPARDFDRLSHTHGLATLGGWSVMLNNTAMAPFDDINFRKAVAYAIDRKTIAEKAYFGMVDPCTVPAPPQSWWYDKAADSIITYDPDRAKDYLKKSKYASNASFEMLTPSVPYLVDTKDAAVAIQSYLGAVGIQASIKQGEVIVVLGQSTGGHAQSLLINIMSPGEGTYLTMVNMTQGQMMTKCSGWQSPELDALLRQIYAENDKATLKPLYAKMMTLLADQSPYTWLGFFDSANVWRDTVKDFKPSAGLSMVVRDTIPPPA